MALLATVERPACRHNKRIIDSTAREVHCRECGHKLDPIWCLLNLVEYRELLDRKLQQIRDHEQVVRQRQERAIAAKSKRRQMEAARQCQACGGTGWMPAAGDAVAKCSCRTNGAPRLV